jgi:hypothetical protein
LANCRILAACLCIENFRSRRGAGDWFDDWVVGHQFEPNYLHHAVFANRAFPRRPSFGRFLRGFAAFHFLDCGLCKSLGAFAVIFGIPSPDPKIPFPAAES